MGSTATIGVWLTIALIGLLLYMLPALLKQLFFVKEQFMGSLDAAKEWEGEQLASVGTEGYVDVPKEAAKAVPEYLQHVPGTFVVGGVGGTSLESQPAAIDQVVEEVTPMQRQGMLMKKAPAAGPVEGFEEPANTYRTSTTCKPKPKPKPKCTSSGSDSGSEGSAAAKCKGPIDLGNYIRKDSIPCWACTL